MSMDLTYLLGVWSYEVSINISCPCILHYLLGGMCGAKRYLFNILAWRGWSYEVSKCFMSVDLTYLLGVYGAMRYILMFHIYGFNCPI
jgi:hypothetical protein